MRPPSDALTLKNFFLVYSPFHHTHPQTLWGWKEFFLICLPFQHTQFTSTLILFMYVSPFHIRGPRAHPQTLWCSRSKNFWYILLFTIRTLKRSEAQRNLFWNAFTSIVNALNIYIYMSPFSLRGPRAHPLTLRRSDEDVLVSGSALLWIMLRVLKGSQEFMRVPKYS